MKEKEKPEPEIDITELWKQSRLFITDEVKIPPIVLRVDESIIGTLGNFSASTGKQKARKHLISVPL